MRYLENYLERIKRKGNLTLADAISKTVSDVVPQYISNFSFREHVVSLLVGDVQSGKTSHMFGLMCAAADEGFVNFILLTTDNILLQQQTFKRAEADLCDFCICDENDYLKFVQNNMRKPAVIVLKKNGRILKQWKNNLSSTNFVAGNPLFIIDDEADAASLNTKVNKNAQSTINKNLEEIKKTTTSSIYMEVTGTPQSILLQTIRSGWKPYFIYYFRPGKGYLGGKLISKVLDLVDSETTDWNAKVFKGFINSMLAENSSEQGKIIVRRDRDISKGTGTLLSPNDRKLGDQYDDEVVLTLYKVTGNKGWDGQKIWIPNIKLPGNRVYYSGNDIPEQDNKLCYDILVNTAKVAESTIPYDHNNK